MTRTKLVWSSLGALSIAGAFFAGTTLTGQRSNVVEPQRTANGIIVGMSSRNDTSPNLRDMPAKPIRQRPENDENENPKIPHSNAHSFAPDTSVTQDFLSEPNMPGTTINKDGIVFPGVSCNCAPPDTNGEVGATQFVQIVNEGYQVFNKSTGASVFGPVGIETVWTGFGGVCEANGHGDPVMLYDQIADRWLISQFAGTSVPTDECVAVSTTSDATGSFNRYDFHLGSNFFDYPHLGVWPDAYYMSMNVFNSAGTAFLGPQAFAFNRSAMLSGSPATFVSPGITGGASEDAFLPADLDGSTLPPSGAPATFIEFPSGGQYKTFHFHADFSVPANTTFTLFAAPAAAGFSFLCPTTRSCVPQSGTTSGLDGIGDRLMFRLAYRNFGDHEAVVGNYTVLSGGVAGIRWFEIRNVTAGPETVFQESTYQPDATHRWMGSVAMDQNGDIALGFSASSSAINPQIRYAGRLSSDPLNTLAQGEAHLFDGTGSQVATSNRWGDYSAMTIDPVDDCTFWYTQEYYSVTSSFNWRTRLANFKFPSCGGTGPLPDLIEKTIAAPATSGSGASIVVKDTVANNGAATAGASTTKIFLSTDTVLDAGDTLLGSRSVPSLAPTKTSAGSTTVTIPSVAPGTYYLIAQADATNAVSESDETNNTFAKKIVLGPDLRVTLLSAPSSAAAGSTITVNDTTKNAGGISDGTATITRYYLSKNSIVEGTDPVLGSRSVPILAANASSGGGLNVTIPAGTAAGVWHIIAVSDATSLVTETIETNNKKVIAITITP
jgi:hypothetical protein